MNKLTLESAVDRLERKTSGELKIQIEHLQADNLSLTKACEGYRNMIETFATNIPSIQAEAAKSAIYALFEVGNCPQYENSAGDGYIECGDALKFAKEYSNKILGGEIELNRNYLTNTTDIEIPDTVTNADKFVEFIKSN